MLNIELPCCCCCLVTESCLTLLQLRGLLPARLLCPLDFPGKNAGLDCHFLLQGIFLTQRSKPLSWIVRQIIYHWPSREAYWFADLPLFPSLRWQLGSSDSNLCPSHSKCLTLFPLFPHLFAMKWWKWMPWSWFSECWVSSQHFTFHFHFHQEAF